MFDQLSEKFTSAFNTIRGRSTLSESNIEEALKILRTALLEADVNFKVVKDFLANVSQKAIGQKVTSGVNPTQQFVKIVQDELASVMGDKHQEINLQRPGPIPLLIVGLNGAGKTTFCGKLALYLKQKQKKDVYLIPADNFRPAAKEQLLTHAKNIGVDFYDSDLGDSIDVITQKGMKEAARLGKDVVIIDTAGRLQVDDDLMSHLVKAKNVLKDPEVLFVADAMTGQEAVNVAKVFHEKVQLTGIILSKMDSDAKGGAALSMRAATQVPIKFVSTGEKLKDLEPFHPDRLASRILDMGDVVSLVEKAQEAIDEKEAEAMMKKMQKNQFSMDDFLKQMDMMGKLGNMESLLKMIPGMGGILRQVGDLSPAEKEMKQMKVMINSMTKAERNNHKLLNASRKKRIVLGSGRTEVELNNFISKFEQMQKMMSGMMGMMGGGGGKGMMNPFGGMFGGGDEPAAPGFRQKPGQSSGQSGHPGKQKAKGKGRGGFGTRFF